MSINKLIKNVALALQASVMALSVTTASIAGVMVSTTPAFAATACDTAQIGSSVASDPLGSGADCSRGGSQKTNLFGSGGIFTVAANTLIFLIGAIAVIYLIIGGLRYVTSGGDSKAVTAAKDTILYAIIGIVVAVISFALVSFVVTALNNAK